MGLSRFTHQLIAIGTVFLFFSPIQGEDVGLTANHILFLLKAGKIDSAFQLYHERIHNQDQANYDLIQEMGMILMENGFHKGSQEEAILSLFGASIAMHEGAISLLQEALHHPSPEIQMLALHLLSRYPSDDTEKRLQPALHSNHVLIRLEALLVLAKEKNPAVIPLIETLMNKLPPPLHFIFPQLFAMIGTPTATQSLRKMLVHSHEKVRTAAILSAAQFGHDDLVSDILRLSRSPNPAQQEACSMALSHLHQVNAAPFLEDLTLSSASSVRLAAHFALYMLGHTRSRDYLFFEAKGKNPFAIYLLGEVNGSEEILVALLNDVDPSVRINASLALLKRRDPRCLPSLKEIVVIDPNEILLIPQTTEGGSLRWWKHVSYALGDPDKEALVMQKMIHLQEEILERAIDFSEEDFLMLVRFVFENKKHDLVPCAIHLLERLATPGAIALLKEHQQHFGSPLIRNYCNLALFRLREEGPYGDLLKKWVETEYHTDLISFHPLTPLSLREVGDPYTLTPEETSGLLIEAFETFAREQDKKGIALLLEAIRFGNPMNKYALAGLLMRATQ